MFFMLMLKSQYDIEFDPDTIAASLAVRRWLRREVNRKLAEIPLAKPPAPKPLPPPPALVVKPQPIVRRSSPAPNAVPITAEQIVARQNSGESVQNMALELGCSPDALWRKLRVAGLVANPKCRHCQQPTGRDGQAFYCYPCTAEKRKLVSSAQYEGPKGIAARAALKVFDVVRETQ